MNAESTDNNAWKIAWIAIDVVLAAGVAVLALSIVKGKKQPIAIVEK